MARRDYWGHRTINFSDLIKVVPKHLRGQVKRAIEDLVKYRFLNKKPGIKSEFRYSLSLDKKQEIDKILRERRDIE